MNKRLLWVLFLLVNVGCSSNHTRNSTTLIESIDKGQLLEHFKHISSNQHQGRKVGTYGNTLTQTFLIEQLKKSNILPYKGAYQHPFIIDKSFSNDLTEGTNIIGLIKGTKNTNKYIVLSAHFDHLGTKGGNIYNGADDNASGTSALLSIASQLAKQPARHNILVLFTDGEESNLKGAKAFIKENPKLVNQIKININMDMLAGSTTTRKLHYVSNGLNKILTEEAYNTFKSKQYLTNLKVVNGFNRQRSHLNRRVNWLKASDHAVFHQEKIPFIYYGVGTHNNYHTKNDIFSNTNHQLLYKSTNHIYQQVLFFDSTI